MPRPYELLDGVETDEGPLELRRRGERDFMISVGGRVLMTSALTRTELALAEHGCRTLGPLPRPRVLLGGLGLGFTLRAALDVLPRRAEVVVAELHERVVQWNRGPVATLNGAALRDPRVRVMVGDVTREIRRLAGDPRAPRYDAILWDLYVGPTRKAGRSDPLYGDRSLTDTRAALEVGGVFGVWAEAPSETFEERLRRHGMTPRLIPIGRGMRHAVYLATKQKPKARHALRRQRKGGRR